MVDKAATMRSINMRIASGDYAKALEEVAQLVRIEPDNFGYIDLQASLTAEGGDLAAALAIYEEFLARIAHADAYFNYAVMCKRAQQLEKAIAAYEQALALDIAGAEEVFSNLGVIYHELGQDGKAIQCFQKALTVRADYVPARFNLASRLEEQGEIEQAKDCFSQILQFDPGFVLAYVRLASLEKIGSKEHPLVKGLLRVSQRPNIPQLDRIDLFYALGKVFDDCGEYDVASDYYKKANMLNGATQPPFDPVTHANYINRIKKAYPLPSSSKSAAQSQDDFAPIFVCGMFRSGSTLVEQILAAHTDVVAGGEMEFTLREIHARYDKFPDAEKSQADQRPFAKRYRDAIENLLGPVTRFTDKRPENYQYIGWLHAQFPAAKFVVTERNMLDNALSVYFQHLGPSMNYATDLAHIKSYWDEQSRLVAHWKKLYPHHVTVVNYDKLVANPEQEIRALIDFLGLEWQSGLLNFHNVQNSVRTASSWQVRQRLYKTSSGRAKHYEKLLAVLNEQAD